MAESILQKRIDYINKPKPTLICPHCNKENLDSANATRWHFDNCKNKKHE